MSSLFDDYAVIAKSGLFDPDYYLSANPDVAALNYDPLMHYLEQGAREMRSPSRDFDARSYISRCRELGENPENPLLHYIRARGAEPRPSTARHEPDFMLALDNALVGGADGGISVNGEGWVLARQPITQIAVTVGRIGGVARYGLTRPDVAQTFPQHPRAEQSGFVFTLTGLQPQETEGNVEILFAVKTADGKTHSHAIETYLSPAPAELSAQLPAASEQTYRGLPPLKLEVDSYAVDDAGILRISGWAVCFAPIVTVQVFIDDRRIGAAHYGLPRKDVASLFPRYPGSNLSGFTLTTDIGKLDAGHKALKVEAIASTGISREVILPLDLTDTLREPPDAEAAINVFNDLVELGTDGWLSLKGWAVCPTETEEIVVELNGAIVGTAHLGQERPDVGTLFPTLTHARRAGFWFQKVTHPVAEGEHMIVLRIRDALGASAEVPLPVLARPDVTRSVEADVIVEPVGNKLMQFNIDLPQRAGGAMINPVRGNLEIAGWAVARDGIAGIDIAIDGEFLTSAFTGVRRLDVFSQFGDWPGALTSGFTTLLSHRSLPVGIHMLSVTLRDNAGNTARSEFSIEVEEAPETLGPWSVRARMPLAEAALGNQLLRNLNWNPHFCVVLCLPASDKAVLAQTRRTLSSIAAQTYPNVSVLVFPQGTKIKHDRLAADLTAGFASLEGRIEIVKRAATTFASLAGERTDGPAYLMALAPGDELSCDALIELAIETGLRPEADFIYGDDRRASPVNGAIEAFFKPDWSPDLLLSTNYVGRAWCASAELIARSGMTLGDIAAAGAYDLALKLTEAAEAVYRVPTVLLQSANSAESVAAQQTALTDALGRRGIDGIVEPGVAPGIFRVRRSVSTQGLVSIIIPTCAARGLIKTCLDTLREKTAYRNFEIVCIENIPADQQDWKVWLKENADVVIETAEPFNWSRFNNLAVAQSHGEFLLFLNDDIEVIREDWLDVLLEHAQRPEVGVVGPQLLYPDRRVQHAGLFLAEMGIGRHAFRYLPEDDPGYFGLALTQRNVIAVTGACMLMRRETFAKLGGFDEQHTIVNNDLDFCLRLWRAGLRTIYTPHTTLIHHEQASRVEMEDIYDNVAFESQWANLFVAGDPFFNPRLSKNRDDFSYDWEPLQLVYPSRPVFDAATIKKILVVKLDHIGDCITALPAIRRLKTHFADAAICVLSSNASKSLWALEPAVDEVIKFDFFHARSELGQVERTEKEWLELSERLTPYGFDLAVDLRKHGETRPVLLHTGARHLAGYDHKGRFPWLDVALEWSEDQASFRKRQHAADDLCNLVDAIAAAGEPSRDLIAPRVGRPPKAAWARALFEKRVVCIHPAAGNDMKQWPPEYFALLINQLLATENVHVALVGGPDDIAVASAILDKVEDRNKVWSMIGKLKLADLPSFIAACALFVGNDSGPKHIAAGLGIPTIGIHSGIVDPREWGPIGSLAVAIDRDMTCSPCYRSKLQECHRSLACLRQILPGDVYRTCRRMLALSPQQNLNGHRRQHIAQ